MANNRQEIREINILRSLMITWIFITHFYEHFNQGPFFGNPSGDWPILAERFRQLKPLPYDGILSIGNNIFRYLGLTGDQGVQVFILISGFVLTLNLAQNNKQKIDYQYYYRRRLVRIYPAWVLSHLFLMATWVLFNKGINPISITTWLSAIGIRIMPNAMYYGVPAWWFIGCLIQLYILFPFLFRFTLQKNKINNLIFILITALFFRLLGLILISEYWPRLLNYWSLGVIFIGRLPEFIAGMLIAVYYSNNPKKFISFIRSARGLTINSMIWVMGFISSFFLAGMAISFLFTAIGIFLTTWGLLLNLRLKFKLLSIFSRVSYEFYLTHHVVIIYLVPHAFNNFDQSPLHFVISFLLSLLSAVFLLWVIQKTNLGSIFERFFNFFWIKRKKVAIIISSLIISFYLAEILIQTLDPQEVNGWGERPALQPDAELGYKLIPNKKTHLRWQTYNYMVTSNSLGFPGPEYNIHKEEHIFRIFVTGDAFESAEGVDTEDSWPRLLENKLNLNDGKKDYEILNFSITGWGPQHYERVVNKYASQYIPDLVILSLFINDLTDVFNTDEGLNAGAGFGQQGPFSINATMRLLHLRRWMAFKISSLAASIFDSVLPKEYYLGHPDLIRKSYLPKLNKGGQATFEHLRSINDSLIKNNSRIFAVVIPTSIQSADLKELSYLPKKYDYTDSTIYDLDQPQKILMSICDSLSIPCFDARKLFKQYGGKGIYMPGNMHFTKKGHEIVADWLAGIIKEY